ncbi:hypothetical protein ROU88_09680 [Macrococcus capreoli]
MNKLYNKDTTYRKLAKEAYTIMSDQKTLTVAYSEDYEMTFNIIAFRQNKFNGLKMAGLTPLGPDGKVNTDELYIVYAGTDPKADYGADLTEDAQIAFAKIGGGLRNKPTKEELADYGNLNHTIIGSDAYVPSGILTNPISQSKESYIFTGALIEKQKPKHVYGAGHSLGGGLALLNAVMYNFDHARVFSAPNTFDLLPTDIKENYRSEKYDGKFYNYIHRTDLIGNSNLFAERIGTQIYAKDIKSDSFLSEINPIFGHFIQEFSFNGDSVHIKMDMYEMQKIADKLTNAVEFVDEAINKLEDYKDETEKLARRIEQKYMDKIDSGNYKYIKSIEISDHMQEISVSGKYKFYNDEYFDNALNELHRLKKETTVFAQQLMYAGYKMESRDKELGELYKIFEG